MKTIRDLILLASGVAACITLSVSGCVAAPSTSGGSAPASATQRDFPLDKLNTSNITIESAVQPGQDAAQAGRRASLRVWLALSSEQHQEGLMYVPAEEIADDQGMLFVFPDERMRGFWMKNTITGLDIAFARMDGTIVAIHTMPPLTLETFPSFEPAMFALEVKAGTFARLAVQEGDKLVIPDEVFKVAPESVEITFSQVRRRSLRSLCADGPPALLRERRVPLTSSPRVLVFAESDASSARLRDMLDSRGLASTACTYDAPPPNLRHGLLAVLLPDVRAAAAGSARLQSLVDRLRSAAIPTLMWSGSRSGEAIESLEGNLDVLSPEVSLEEVVGRLMTLAHYVPLVRCLDDESTAPSTAGHQLNRYIGELDRDMQLAGRLQRDFMPRGMPTIEGIRFSYVFRPASFVSGDIFDIIPIDEHCIGMFIADAMGHGTAAGLITMFLRKALIPRVGTGSNMRVLGPAEALRTMHEGLARHELPNANFVTAAYALIDCRTHEVRYARGGHPYPLLIRADGSILELAADGGLLGIADLHPEFVELSFSLAPGDKLVFYTDGLEELFIDIRETGDGLATFTPLMREWAKLDVVEFAAAIESHLDRQIGSLNPADDVSIVALQRAR